MREIKIDNESGCAWLYGSTEDWKEYVSENFDEIFVIHGNRDYNAIEEAAWYDEVKYLMRDFDELDWNDKDDVASTRQYYHDYSDEQWKAICKIYDECKVSDSDDTYLKVLQILHPEEKWEIGTIRGYSQSEWNDVLYKATNVENLDTLEAYYYGHLTELYDETENVTAIVTHDKLWEAERENKLGELIRNYLDIPKDEEIHVQESDGTIQVTKWKEVSL